MDHLIAAGTDFLTAKALGTFSGASVATVITGNTFRLLSRRDWPIIPFVCALGFAYAAATIVGHPKSASDYGLILLNACLLFCTALGANEVLVSGAAASRAKERVGAHGRSVREVKWLQPWFRAAEPAGRDKDGDL